jgi:hypothetical protein
VWGDHSREAAPRGAGWSLRLAARGDRRRRAARPSPTDFTPNEVTVDPAVPVPDALRNDECRSSRERHLLCAAVGQQAVAVRRCPSSHR